MRAKPEVSDLIALAESEIKREAFNKKIDFK